MNDYWFLIIASIAMPIRFGVRTNSSSYFSYVGICLSLFRQKSASHYAKIFMYILFFMQHGL